MKKIFLSSIAAATLLLTGCGTTQKTATTGTETGTYAVNPVDVESEVLNIKDALSLFDNNELITEISKKYGYKVENEVNIHNLENYKTMLYKNCTLSKKSKSGIYVDLPKPQRKGISSYIGLTGSTVEIGVFNTKAYDSLIEQIKQAGFKLTQDGYEQEYNNGVYSLNCYAPGKRVIIKKAI